MARQDATTLLDEEILYPAFQRATGDQDVLRDSLKEHQQARELIARTSWAWPTGWRRARPT